MENPIEEFLQREATALANDTTLTVSPERFLEYLLLLAVKRRASDVHVRPMSNGINIAFRVDGVLRSEMFFPKR